MQTAPELSLLGFLKNSFERFLQLNAPASGQWSERDYALTGLQAVFKSIFPVSSKDKLSSLEYVSYSIERPKFNAVECLRRGMTFAAPIKVIVRLVVWEETDHGTRSIRDFKEQEVYFGEIPLLTERGTFIYNGEERVFPNLLRRSPGVFFSKTLEGHPSALVSSWLGVTLSIVKQQSSFWVQLSAPPDLPLSLFLYPTSKTVFLSADGKDLYVSFDDVRPGKTATVDLKAPDGEVIVGKKQRITATALKKLRASGALGVLLSRKESLSFYSAEDVYFGGELLLKKDQALLGGTALQERGIFSVRAYSLLEEPTPPKATLLEDERALREWYETNIKLFDVSTVGRIQLNQKLSLTIDPEAIFLQREDVFKIIEYLSAMSRGSAPEDDPNHLGGWQLCCAGEQLELRSWLGIMQIADAIQHRMSLSREVDTLMPHDLVNAKPLFIALRRLLDEDTQPLDTTNPLSMLCQLRRVQTPKDFAPHRTHQGRLSNSERSAERGNGFASKAVTSKVAERTEVYELALYGKPNDFLFLEAPYFQIEKGQSRGLVSLSPFETEHLLQNGAKLSLHREVSEAHPTKRRKEPAPSEIELVEVSLLQNLSLSEALGRSLQKALPLYQAEAPRSPSSLEALVVREAQCILTAKRAGEVSAILSGEILLSTEESLLPERYSLLTLAPSVTVGQRVEAGAVLASDLTSRGGSLSLGREVSVEFSEGLGGALASTKLKSRFASRHLLRLECVLCDTREGKEFLQKSIPEAEEAKGRHLDESGIVTIDAQVAPGDILVGKRTPTSTGSKDASLYVPEGYQGKVVHVEIFSRPGVELNPRQEALRQQKDRYLEELEKKITEATTQNVKRRFRALVLGKQSATTLRDDKAKVLIPKGAILTEEMLDALPFRYAFDLEIAGEPSLFDDLQRQQDALEEARYAIRDERALFYRRDELPPGVVMLVKITIEQERELSLGDTLADTEGHQWTITAFTEDASVELRVPATTPGVKKKLYLVKLASS